MTLKGPYPPRYIIETDPVQQNEISQKLKDMKALRFFQNVCPGLKCAPEQFHCLNTMSNTILSINDWNREGETCIDGSLRCDGRSKLKEVLKVLFYSSIFSDMTARMALMNMSADLKVLKFPGTSGNTLSLQ